MNETLIQVGGFYNITLVVFHVLFWRIFDWKKDLQSLTILNRAIIQVLNISLTIVFVVFAYISFVHTEELLNSKLGFSIVILMSLFWFARAFQQIVFFKLKHWVSWAFFAYFVLGGVIYAIPVIYNT